MDIIHTISYSVQVCDTKNRAINDRVCGSDRTTLSKKSIESFLLSVKYSIDKNLPFKHVVRFFIDNASNELVKFVEKRVEKYSSEHFHLSIEHLGKVGINKSIQRCNEWLVNSDSFFVYLVQDDYLFLETAIFEMIELQGQIYAEFGHLSIVEPYNDPYLWRSSYRNKSTPRIIISTPYRYWIQTYDIPCTFMCTREVLNRMSDLYEIFYALLDSPTPNRLEAISINKILSERGVPGLLPINTLAFHLQSELEQDPYIDWKPLWNSIAID